MNCQYTIRLDEIFLPSQSHLAALKINKHMIDKILKHCWNFLVSELPEIKEFEGLSKYFEQKEQIHVRLALRREIRTVSCTHLVLPSATAQIPLR